MPCDLVVVSFVQVLNLPQHLLRAFEDELRHVERLERQVPRQLSPKS